MQLSRGAGADEAGVYCDTVEPRLPEPAAQLDKNIQDIFIEVRHCVQRCACGEGRVGRRSFITSDVRH